MIQQQHWLVSKYICLLCVNKDYWILWNFKSFIHHYWLLHESSFIISYVNLVDLDFLSIDYTRRYVCLIIILMGASKKAFVLHVSGSEGLYNLMFPIKVHPVVFAWILLLPENKQKINNLTPCILNNAHLTWSWSSSSSQLRCKEDPVQQTFLFLRGKEKWKCCCENSLVSMTEKCNFL